MNAPKTQAGKWALLLVMLAVFVAGARPQAANPGQPPPDSLRIPFDRASHRNALLVHVRVNSRAVLLILDTGSAHTVLCPETAGVRRSELSPTHTSQSGAAFIGDAMGKEVKLEVGERAWPKYRVVVMDLSQILAAYQEHLDGVLGLDFLQQFRHVAIDWNERKIILTP